MTPVVKGQVAILKKVLRRIASHKRDWIKDNFGEYRMNDGIWNGCIDYLIKEIKEIKKELK
jgi:hypothetical protein